MTKDWLAAASRYDDANQRAAKQQAVQKAAEPPNEDAWSDHILSVSHGLMLFLQSADGQVAMKLLRASKQIVRFGIDDDCGPHCAVYYLDGNGFMRSIEPKGTWAIYETDKTKTEPKISTIKIHELVEAALNPRVSRAKLENYELVAWLRGEIDKIAAAAPKPEPAVV